jgi:hypothetical protein
VTWFRFDGGVDWLVEAHLRDVFEFCVLCAFGDGWEDLGLCLIRRWWDDGFL